MTIPRKRSNDKNATDNPTHDDTTDGIIHKHKNSMHSSTQDVDWKTERIRVANDVIYD